MKYPIKFTFLGFYFNSLVDGGEFVDLQEMHNIIEQENMFARLNERFAGKLDISLFSNEELRELEDFFKGLSREVDEGRKMGVSENGLCLLVAYCFEGAQRRPEDI